MIIYGSSEESAKVQAEHEILFAKGRVLEIEKQYKKCKESGVLTEKEAIDISFFGNYSFWDLRATGLYIAIVPNV